MEYKNFIQKYSSGNINFYQMDCMELLRQTPDKYYQLCITDPPYGIKEHGLRPNNRTEKWINPPKETKYKRVTWDNTAPDKEYFDELMRVSKNQIVWGANHFISRIPYDSSCWIVWDKKVSGDFADCELAWTSFDTAVRKFKWRWQGMLQQNMKNKQERIHPNEKPISLYRWILQKYAKQGDKILDTHGGSASSAIACDMEGFDLDICEIDLDYFEAGKKRFETYKQQPRLF